MKKFHGNIQNLRSRIEMRGGKGRCIVYYFDVEGVPHEFVGDRVPKNDTKLRRDAFYDGDDVCTVGISRFNGNLSTYYILDTRNNIVIKLYDKNFLIQLITGDFFMVFMAMNFYLKSETMSKHLHNAYQKLFSFFPTIILLLLAVYTSFVLCRITIASFYIKDSQRKFINS